MDRTEWDERYRAAPVLWPIDPGPFLGGEVGGQPAGRALDLGSGEGRNSVWLAERGWRVTAVDFSEVAIDRGREQAREAGVEASIAWVNEDLLEFRPATGVFDLVLSLFVHLPAEDRRAVLRRAVDSLAEGGTILVVGYDRANATEGKDGVRDPKLLFTAEEIAQELDGLRVERAEQLRVGNAVDAIFRARKVSAAPRSERS